MEHKERKQEGNKERKNTNNKTKKKDHKIKKASNNINTIIVRK